MAAILSPNAKQQFFDNAGQPAAGYRLYTYAANTTNPQATFTDRAGLIPNANPIILDARGEAVIYLTPGLAYDYQFKSPNDAQVWTVEDVSAETGDANSVAFIQQGAGAVTRSIQAKAGSNYTANDFGAVADGASDASPSIAAVKTNIGGSGVVKFESNPSQTGTYKLGTLGTNDFSGLTLDIPDGMTLDLPTSAYGPLKQVRFARQTEIHFSDLDFNYSPVARKARQRNKDKFIGGGDLRMQRLRTVNPNTGLRFLSVPINTSDTFSSDTPTLADSTQYSYSGKATGTWYGGFHQLRRGETYSCSVAKTGSGAVGVMFRHNGGYSVLYADPSAPSTALMWRQIKATGGAIATAQDVSFPGRGSYTSYDPSKALWGVTILDNGTALVTLNGRAVTQPVWTTSLGDIYEVGFVFQPTAGGASAAFTDTMVERNTDPLGRSELPEIRIFGDSTSEYLTGMWQDDFKDMLDHTFGMKLGAISNLAVSGTNSFDVYQSITTNGLGGAYYVVVGIGTNDIQSGASLTTFANNITGILTSIQAAGRVPVMVMPYMWYGRSQIGSSTKGQPSTNYDAGAPYRARLARLCSDAGAILVDPTRELPEPKPSYITTDTSQDPLVRDNIHQSYLGYKLYAWAIARAIASHAAQRADFKDYRVAVPTDWMRNSYTAGTNLKVQITDNGLVTLQGNMSVASGANNVVTMNLPRWARPEVDQVFPVVTNASPNALGQLTVAADGNLRIDGVGSSFTVIHLGGIRFYAA